MRSMGGRVAQGVSPTNGVVWLPVHPTAVIPGPRSGTRNPWGKGVPIAGNPRKSGLSGWLREVCVRYPDFGACSMNRHLGKLEQPQK